MSTDKPNFDQLVAHQKAQGTLSCGDLDDYQLTGSFLVCEFGLYQLSVCVLVRLGRLHYDGKTSLSTEEFKASVGHDADQIFDWARANIEAVREAYEECPEPDLFSAYIGLRREMDAVRREALSRLGSRKVGTLLLFADHYPEPKRLVGQLERTLRIERLRAYEHHKAIYDDMDFKQEALKKALDLFRQQEQIGLASEGKGTLAFPTFIVPHNVTERFWMKMFEEFWWPRFVRRDLARRLFVLQGDLETAPQKVRDHQRNEWATTKRRKKLLEGSEDFPKDGPESWRADWDFSKTAEEGRRKELEPEFHARTSNPEDLAVEVEDLREKKLLELRAYKIAIKRADKQGNMYLDGLKAGKTNIDAAQAAGISRRTGERIKEVIRQSLPSETLKKTRR